MSMQKYIYISNDIRNKILIGKHKANEQLPFEKDLCLDYQVSKMTIKKALDLLVSEGLIIKRRGAGTFVKDLSSEELKRIAVGNQFRGTTALNIGKKVESEVLNFSIVEAEVKVKEKLNLTQDCFVYDVHRVRYINGKPLVIEHMYMPIDIIPGLQRQHVEQSIYEYIGVNLDLTIQSAHRTISVRKATEIECKYLDLKEHDPVAVSQQIAYLANGTAFEYSTSIHRYDQFSVSLILSRE